MQSGDERAEQQFNMLLQYKYALEIQVRRGKVGETGID